MKKVITSICLLVIGAAATLATVYAFDPELTFPDVDYDAYYMEGLSNMVQRGVIQGYEDGTFGPDDPVTRAQMVTMLDRYDAEVRNMKSVICGGMDRELLPTDDPSYGDLTVVFDTLCAE